MTYLPTEDSASLQLQYDIAHGICCASCHEYFSVSYGAPTLCTTICWTRTDPEDRVGFLQADRNTEERVYHAKLNRRKEANG